MSRRPPGPTWFRPVDFFQAGLAPPLPVLQRLAARYGDPFRVSYLSGAVTFTGNPEALRAIYTADPAVFAVWGVDNVEPVFGRTSVVVTAGERHSRDRKLLMPAFHGGAMRAFGATMAEITGAKVAGWVRGRPFEMLDTTQSIALEIMVRVVFGVQDEVRARKTGAAVLALIDSLNVLLFLFPALRREFGGRGPWARYRAAVEALNALLREEIAARRGQTAARADVLSVMMLAQSDGDEPLTEVELLDHLRGLLFAGHEATATVLAWALRSVHRDPPILERVLAEIDELGANPAAEDLAALPYLEAVCKETLRLYPPVVDPARLTRAPFEMAGFTVPAGEAIRPSMELLHGREELYPSPTAFRPERFLGRKYSPFEYIPFGGGARRCLGAAFAMYEMKVVLATILRSNHLQLVSQAPVSHARRRLTLGPLGGIPMIFLGRRRAEAPAARRPERSPLTP